MIEFIRPDWPAPTNVRAAVSTRGGGVSPAPWDSLNLGAHVEDSPDNVTANRLRLVDELALPEEPHWLKQVHGVAVANLDSDVPLQEADAVMTARPGKVCAVQTADCLPVLFCNASGTQVAAAHAGWRGLADGVLEATVEAMGCPAEELLAWFGPAIGPTAFEVGGEVIEQFASHHDQAHEAFRSAASEGKWLGDMYLLARQRLNQIGIRNIYGGGLCTYTDAARFFSFRRDGQRSGRMASLIWME